MEEGIERVTKRPLKATGEPLSGSNARDSDSSGLWELNVDAVFGV